MVRHRGLIVLALASLALPVSARAQEEGVRREGERRGREVVVPGRHESIGGRVIVRGKPPEPRNEIRGLAPSPRHIWVGGHWSWKNRWIWIPGRWSLPPRRGALWVEGHWVAVPGGWSWVAGKWGR